MDHAAVRRVRDREGVERAVPPARRGRHGWPQCRLRPADADGLRQRRADRPRGGGQGRCRDRLDRRHAHPVRRAAARRDVDLDDHQRARRGAAAAVPAGRRGARDPRRQADRDDPERRAQGVHRAGHLHLPAEAVPAAGLRRVRLLPQGDSALEHDLHLRLPHGRSGGHAGAGDRVHPLQRDRLRPRRPGRRSRRRRLRSPAVVLLRRPHHLAGGGREVPGGPADLGAGDARRLRRDQPQVADAPVPHPDRRRAADRAAAGGQPRPGRAAGSRRGPRRHPEPAHQLVRRGHRPARRRRPPASRYGPSRSSPTRPTSRKPSTRSPVRTPSRP